MGFVSKHEDDRDRYEERIASLTERTEATSLPSPRFELEEELERYTRLKELTLAETRRNSDEFQRLSAQSRTHPPLSQVAIGLDNEKIACLDRFMEYAGEVTRFQDRIWRIERRLS